MELTRTGDRDEWLKSICPRIASKADAKDSLMRFEEHTLIPILGFQSQIIFAQFKGYVRKFKPAFNAYNQNIQKNYISDVMDSDPRIKNSLIATMVSLMTLDEYEFYCNNKRSINKSIISLLTDSLQNHLAQLY